MGIYQRLQYNAVRWQMVKRVYDDFVVRTIHPKDEKVDKSAFREFQENRGLEAITEFAYFDS